MYARVEGRPAVSIRSVAQAVGAHYGIEVRHMTDHRRSEPRVVAARQVAHYLSVRLSGRSLPEIGHVFDRDHTTILHSRRVIEERLEAEAELRADVAAIDAYLRRLPEVDLVAFVRAIEPVGDGTALTSAIAGEIICGGGSWPVGDLIAAETPGPAVVVISLHGVVASGRTTAAACEAWRAAARQAVDSLTNPRAEELS